MYTKDNQRSYLLFYRTVEPIVNFEHYIEVTLGYCPTMEDDICEKFKKELQHKNIECDAFRAERLKTDLLWKCKNGKEYSETKKYNSSFVEGSDSSPDAVYPEHDLLPEHIRPEKYEVWLWVKKERKILGNVTINVVVKG